MDGNGDTDAENVIRLPRDWVGPPEELVPLGSRARARERAPDDPADDGADSDVILDAGDFWGESASAVHRVMRAPTETPSPRRARRNRARRWPPRMRGRTAALVAIVSATATLAIIGVSEGRGPRPAVGPVAQARVHGSAAPSRATGTRSDRRSVTHAGRGVTHSAPTRSISEPRSTRHTTLRRSRGHHGTSRHRHAPAPPSRHPRSVVTTAVAAPVPTTPVSATTTSMAPAPTATTARDGGTLTSGTRAGQTPTPPSGPVGAGDAVGCDPKCS